MLEIERTKDPLLVKALATDPKIFPQIADDYHAIPGDWQPVLSELVITLVARDRKGYFGFAVFIPRTWSCFEAHLGFLPRSYGAKASTAFKEMLAWMWTNNKTVERIIGEIVVENRLAIAFAKRAGCKEYGINARSELRGGILRDRVCLGISRPL